MTPNCNQDASLIHAREVNENDGNVGVWMLTRIMVSKLQNAVIEEVRLPLNPDTEASGMIIRESSKEILIAAGRHGLLIVPLLFDSDTRPRRLMKPTNNQTILGVQLFNDIPYVFVKDEDENDIDSYSLIKVGAASNISQVSRSIPTGSRDASYERMMWRLVRLTCCWILFLFVCIVTLQHYMLVDAIVSQTLCRRSL
jgi:hypothetical protein